MPEFARFGRTALTVSRVGLGTVNFGGRVDESEAHRLLDRARDNGVNLVDTANMYGWRVHKGHTEETIGRWLKQGGGRRESTVLATKVGNPMGDSPNEGGLSARHIIAECEQSLRRLGTEWIDLYQMHHIDRTACWDEVWQAMEALVLQGKVRYVGSSNFAGWHLARAQATAARRNTLGVVSEQCLYNLLSRQVESEVLPAAEELGMAVLPWSPLHSGVLGGVLRKQRDGAAVKGVQGRAAVALQQHRSTLKAYEDFCERQGKDPADVGLAWVLSRPSVTSAIVGPRTVEQLDGVLRACRMRLAQDELNRLDELFPPPGGGRPAPEAWLD
ncbi:NDP-hexose 2,3-enoyl reductase [Actinopolyspora biskrensis]|uniref:NDP-hexose 2,3-enoyl reductase n=1 Tax=Actinopolyspora biskrensis TaxID=1470178 RepID=A0A852Z4U2_9ACTN|nr:aldo/keto reductase [Actinopolyspora biskrensis]NYH77273.1 NDP-hexose 2,3-enoyl reductase [Actinopolyspora biskrensis]